MSMHHAVVWLDRTNAHVLHFNADAVETDALKAHPSHPHLKAKAGDGHAPDNGHFYNDIAAVLEDTPEILITGPGQEKLFFAKHLARHHPAIAGKVLGIEAVDHPSDGQLLAYARKHFHKIDLMR